MSVNTLQAGFRAFTSFWPLVFVFYKADQLCRV